MNRFAIYNLKKYFERGGYFLRKDRQLVLDIPELTIEEDQSVGLIGESGSGKTTVARLLMRIISPECGRIEYFGRDIMVLRGDELKRYRQECQMIFQDPSSQFNPRMTIREILLEPLIINGIKDGIEERIGESLMTVSLPVDIKDRYIHQISGGQRQRISIARAIILRPSFVICDEPVSALDISVQTQILNLLSDMKKRRGIHYLLISHDLSVVRYLCDYIYILYNGRIIESGLTDEIFSDPLHPYTQELIGAMDLNPVDLDRLREVDSKKISPESGHCTFERCRNYDECLARPPVKRNITKTHSVYCNL